MNKKKATAAQNEVVNVPADAGHFHGELYVGPVVSLPAGPLRPAARESGVLVVGHSETGHHHVVEAPDVRLLETGDPLIAYLVAEGAYADLVHRRDFDTHPTLHFAFSGEGTGRKVVRQREMTPSGWVRAAD